jgi:hypothetical protein
MSGVDDMHNEKKEILSTDQLWAGHGVGFHKEWRRKVAQLIV